MKNRTLGILTIIMLAGSAATVAMVGPDGATETPTNTATKTPTNTTDYGPEWPVILRAAKRNNLRPELYPLLMAIRRAENGRAGRELGILHPRAIDTNMDTQAGWAAATVQKNYDRWLKAGQPGEFITFLGARWAPVGAANDPTNLNRNWVRNVTHWETKLKGQK